MFSDPRNWSFTGPSRILPPEASCANIASTSRRTSGSASASRAPRSAGARFCTNWYGSSFITGEAEPNDVDVFLLMEDSFDVDQTSDELRLLFEHSAAQAYFGASIFWLRRLAVISSEQAAIEDWQVKRDGTRRGIVEIV